MTSDQRQRLLEVYLANGFTAAKPLAIEFGISPRSIAKYARAVGHKGRRGRESGKWKGKTGRTHHDSRWQKAIERGAIEA
jgi:hypothetical protein